MSIQSVWVIKQRGIGSKNFGHQGFSKFFRITGSDIVKQEIMPFLCHDGKRNHTVK
ncbi:hypothetical protein [Neisseria shayeganii]|uniref:Uncharacterized protein n=1 Tax=Neisseria shayeganii 871 TaxID=1032488 RepID=G4CJX1_9NEIS|nr:hypothetical protein [Neisseria shayeganii]EGY51862.1 hypothetical protein HMPREF9371_1911 [Neisseria shayeganii 871]